ncbi:EAL domain-containing protein [Caulobacter sp. DWR1-3-2b1]|uniref:EAL domain-containing protein n=1 Tax=Caulobacter sp. DWR1-3-2b1 TaxID=2804670 RepID=UPI003CE6D37B
MTIATGCNGCRDGAGFELPITMAFQPIVDASTGAVFAHEALVRGANGEGAASVLAQVSDTNRYAFDQQCRVTAIELAARLKMADHGANLSINFLPNAVYEPRACIRLTLAAAMRSGFPLNRIIFEFTEVERLDTDHILHILRSYRAMGFQTAIDDFGAGYAGLGLLSKFQPDIVKLDMDLIRDIDTSTVKQTIVGSTLGMLRDLGVTPLCEGVETVGEYEVLRSLGVDLMQGYLLAKPALAALTIPVLPGQATDISAVA